MKLRYLIFICVLSVIFLSEVLGYTKDPRVRFERFSINDGLSHLGVSSFFQDNQGFLWIGTYDGLNRFDGINFKVFKHIPGDSTTLGNNRVRCVLEHSSGKIFIGTEKGLSAYSPEQEIFHEYNFGILGDKMVTVLKLFEDSEQRLWILTNKSVVYVLDVHANDVKSLFFVSNRKNSNVTFNDITEDNHGFIWMATSNGLICYQKDLKQVTPDMPAFLANRMLRTVEFDTENNLWISFNTMVREFSVDYAGNKVEVRLNYAFHIESIVTSLLADSKGNVWLGSSNEGVFRIVRENDNRIIENYTFAPSSTESISSNWVNEVYEDKHGNIWLATAEKGLNKYTYEKGLFLNVDENSGLSHDYVLELFQYDAEKILCGTRNGFSVFNHKTEKIEKAWFDDSELNSRNIQVSGLFKDKNNMLLFAIPNGIFYLKPGLEKQTGLLEHAEVDLSNWYVLSFAEDNYGNIWVGTTLGIFRITIDDGPQISEMLDFDSRDDKLMYNIRCSEIYVDPADSSIWIGSWYNGLFHIEINGAEKNVNDFNIKNYRFKSGHPETIGSDFISAILRSEKGDLWIGTEGGGLNMLTNKAFKHYTEKDGLSNNVVKSIVEDNAGKLFIGTNYKLNVFNPENESFIYYDVNDGLKSAYFNTIAIKLQNGEMAFGGNEGFTIFNPTQLEDNKKAPIPEFGDFQLSYQKVHPGEKIDGKVLIKKSLPYINEIHLKHYQNTFSFELLGINFDDPEDTYYKYHLNDYDQEWIITKSSNNMASYSNVAPGEYLFEFTASNSKNAWSSAPKQLKIIISPPFWKTGWAYSLYVILFLAIIFSVFYFVIKLERLKSNLRIEQLEKEKEKEVNDIKLRFFTNISHEFKTPVSLILGPAENLIQKFRENDGIKRNLMMIHGQANYLLRLVDQLLEFRKVEKEKLKLNCAEKEIVSFVKNIAKGFDSKSIEKNIRYNFETGTEALKIWFDPSKIEMIVYNLLSNAFKFTPSGGVISVQIENDSEFVTIKVADNGPGISKEEQTKIFERFYQSNSTAQLHGTGIGLTLSKSLTELHKGELLVKSEKGEGATFMLKLPLGHKHLSKDEIADNKAAVLEGMVNDAHNFPVHMEEAGAEGPDEKEQGNLPILLLVEDNFQMRNYLKDVLSEYYRVITADNGKEGFSLAIGKVPDIVVSDVMMPAVDGVQLLKKLKNELITSHIPVILLTVKSEFNSYIQGIEIGADDYISKPFHVEHLLARIKNLIENRARMRARYGRDFKDNRPPDAQFSNRDTEFIHTLSEIAEKNVDNPEFSADDFSKAVFMSRTNFYKKMKALTDQTPGEFLRSYRVKKAGEFLSSGEYSVSQVTQMVGFKSRSHFYQCFKNFYGELPTEFIRNNKANHS